MSSLNTKRKAKRALITKSTLVARTGQQTQTHLPVFSPHLFVDSRLHAQRHRVPTTGVVDDVRAVVDESLHDNNNKPIAIDHRRYIYISISEPFLCFVFLTKIESQPQTEASTEWFTRVQLHQLRHTGTMDKKKGTSDIDCTQTPEVMQRKHSHFYYTMHATPGHSLTHSLTHLLDLRAWDCSGLDGVCAGLRDRQQCTRGDIGIVSTIEPSWRFIRTTVTASCWPHVLTPTTVVTAGCLEGLVTWVRSFVCLFESCQVGMAVETFIMLVHAEPS